MNDKFDELAKAMAQPVARRAALKRFGFGLAAFALAAVGLTPTAQAASRGIGEPCKNTNQCQKGLVCDEGVCMATYGGPGMPCNTNADCAKGLVCRYTGGLTIYSCQYR
jgi:hypothetical protein